MATLRVPERHLTALARVLSFSETEVQALISAFADTSLTLNPSESVTEALSKLDFVSAEDRKKVSDALLSLFMARASTGDTIEDFVDNAIEAIEEASIEGFSIADSNREGFKERLSIMLSVSPVAISAKAVSILYEHERIFSKARIVSDIRPVFGDDVTGSPDAAIIVHTLNIHYYEGAAHKEFFVSMDDDEAQKLIDTLKRAQTKVASLKAVLQTAQVPLIASEGD